MSPLLAAAFALFLYLMVRLLNITHPATAPLVYAKDRSSQFVQSVLTMCPILHQPYQPPLLWGKSGHIQTIVYARMGRFNIRVPDGVRHSKIMPDGANLTFDLYEALKTHPTGEKCCILFCPGIGNNSESKYIQSLVHHAQQQGYIAVVLNHLGSLKKLPLSSPRLFSYGGTEELAAVRAEVERIHPGCRLILVGCSMGANIVVKYLGEDRDHQRGVLAAISVNQGYNVLKAMHILKSWRNLGRFYVYVMTANQKSIIKAHREQLLSPENMAKHGIDKKKVLKATSMDQLDEAFFVRLFGYDSLEHYYDKMSSYKYLPNIQIPLLILNAEDDPVVPPPLLEFPMEAANTQPYTMFVLTKHGGHLGFYERGIFRPSDHTWMDRLILEYSNAITSLHKMDKLPLPVGGSAVFNRNSLVDKYSGGDMAKEAPTLSDATMTNNNVADENEGRGEGAADRSTAQIPVHGNGTDSIKMHNGLSGEGDSFSTHGLVLEALKASTNTAQL